MLRNNISFLATPLTPMDDWPRNPVWYVVLIIIQLSQGHTDPVGQDGATQPHNQELVVGDSNSESVETWALNWRELWVTVLKKVKTIEPLKNIAWWWYERTCRYNSHKLCAHTASRCSLRSMRHNHDKHTHRKLWKLFYDINIYDLEYKTRKLK